MMRCPDCHELISWVPRPDGRRAAITAAQNPEGDWYLDANGILRAWHPGIVRDVPRYVTHTPCPRSK